MNNLIKIAMENEDREFKKECYFVLAVKVLIERKIKIKINLENDEWARSDSDKFDLMIMSSHQKINRSKNNQCNKLCFKEEYKKSENELIQSLSEHC